MFLRATRLVMALGLGTTLTSCGVATYLNDGPLPAPREQSQSGPDLPSRFNGATVARYSGGYGGFFNAPELDALIAEAANHNPDYLLLRARVDREWLRIADKRLSGGPSLSGSLSNTERRGSGVDSTSYGLNVDLNPALDIWGKTAADIQSGVLGTQATLFDLVASEQALQKGIVRAWANLIAAKSTLALRYDRLASYEDILEATKGEIISGKRDPIDLQLAEIDVLSAKSQLEVQRNQVEVSQSSLNRLLGRTVGADLRLRTSALPRFAGAAPTRLPSELLTRRPDIQAAWARVLSVDEAFKSARLAMLPRFNLTGSDGLTTDDLANLLDADRLIANLVISLSGTLLDNGASQRQVDMAMANITVELHAYASTVLDAMVEVDQILAKERSLKRRIGLQKTSATLAEEAFAQKTAAMRDGDATLFEVSQAALRLYNSQDEIISLRNQILQNRLDLYVALGDEYFDGEAQ